MDKKEAKEFSHDAIYGLNEMLSLINEQTQEIDYLHDKLDDITISCNSRITDLEEQIDKLDESPDCPIENISFDGESDFYEE